MNEHARQRTGTQAQQPVARFNPESRWPEEYFAVLADADIPSPERPFHAHANGTVIINASKN